MTNGSLKHQTNNYLSVISVTAYSRLLKVERFSLEWKSLGDEEMSEGAA